MIVTLAEWTTASPATEGALEGVSFDRHLEARALAERLEEKGRLAVTERRQGLHIETTSFVGSLSLGPIQLRIQPKVRGAPLLALLRYAYGLRHLDLLPAAAAAVGDCGFEELLLFQLAAEVTELVSRGLHRAYVSRDGWLARPHGRIDFGTLARRGGVTRAALPCRAHHRLTDCLPNRVLLTALQRGVRLANDDGLRTRLQQLVQMLDEQVAPINLDQHVLVRLRRQMTRLTRAYEPAIQLIELLAAGQGMAIEPEALWRLPGFLFDMNRFFEVLVFRFLREHLTEADVWGQAGLQDIFEYEAEFNPRNRRAPRPRPDLLVRQAGHRTQLLDTKYRDLWEHPLPREMLYQLSVYTLSHAGSEMATILYPTTSPAAREARIAIRGLTGGGRRGLVALRPVRLDQLADLLAMRPSVEAMRRRCTLARQLVYGCSVAS